MKSHSAASVRSRSSRSPSQSHSASASICSSARNRKRSVETQTPPLPYSHSDALDGTLTSNDELESFSERGSEEEVGDDEEDNAFENRSNSRNCKLKSDNSLLKFDSSTSVTSDSSPMDSISGIVVKEDSTKGIYADNVQKIGAYCAREERLMIQEEAGKIKFVCVAANYGINEHLVWLVGLKNVYARQLPKMPKEYIVRLVMDRNHKSVMIIRRNQVIGGITYRPYVSQKFGEIAFCAIRVGEQEKGYGTRLMNHLKQHARDIDGLTHFLTCADNNAVKYFAKQGFTEEIDLEKDKWQGYIKEYDGVVLMQCKLFPKFPYTNLSTVTRQQRQAIEKKIRELSNCHIVYPGIDFQKNEVGIPNSVIKVEDIPGLREAGWTPDASTNSATNRHSLNIFMRALLKMVNECPDAWPFREPVDSLEVPDYYEIIKDPIDLKTMLKRLESEQYYVTFEMFVADVERMFENARKYNSPDTVYYKCATRLKNFFSGKIQACQNFHQ